MDLSSTRPRIPFVVTCIFCISGRFSFQPPYAFFLRRLLGGSFCRLAHSPLSHANPAPFFPPYAPNPPFFFSHAPLSPGPPHRCLGMWYPGGSSYAVTISKYETSQSSLGASSPFLAGHRFFLLISRSDSGTSFLGAVTSLHPYPSWRRLHCFYWSRYPLPKVFLGRGSRSL